MGSGLMSYLELKLFIAKALMRRHRIAAPAALVMADQKIARHPTADQIGKLRKAYRLRSGAFRGQKGGK